MTGRELLETLLKMDPADLEREVVAEYSVPDNYNAEYIADTCVVLDTVIARDVPLIAFGKSRDTLIPVITIR